MVSIAASDWVDDRPDEPELFADAELVIYSTPLDAVEFEAGYDWMDESGLATASLWARYPDDEVEIPLFSLSPMGVWLSLSVDVSGDETDDAHVSDAFIDFNAYPWDVRESDWDAMPEAEKIIANSLRWSVIEMDLIPESAGVVEWCRARTDREEPDG